MKPSDRIEIVNKTTYCTRDFRKIFTLAFREWHKNHLRPSRIRVEITWKEGGGIHGYAYFNSRLVYLQIPDRLKTESQWNDIGDFVDVFMHELFHCEGARHIDMKFNHSYYPKYNREKFKGMVIKNLGLKSPKPAPTTNDKMLRINERIKRWQSKAKRAANAIRKLQKSLKYYQRLQIEQLTVVKNS
jgi:hypothetical protein